MNQKRRTIKKIAGISTLTVLTPTSWVKPIVNSVVLPAHAQTSNLVYRVGTYGFKSEYRYDSGTVSTSEACIDFRADKSIIFRYENKEYQPSTGEETLSKWHGKGSYNVASEHIIFNADPCSDSSYLGNITIFVHSISESKVSLVIKAGSTGGALLEWKRRGCNLSHEC